VSMLSNEVWRQLDPEAGRLPRRTVQRLRWTVATVLVLALLAGVGWRSGLITPRLAWPNAGGGLELRGNRVEYEVHVVNRGWTPIEVVGLGRSGPGFELVEVHATLPTTLKPGERMDAVLLYRINDCAAVPAGPWPMPVQVRRTWGTVTAYVDIPTGTSPGAPDGMRQFTGRDPYAVQWQRLVADLACDPNLPRGA
jgi:hypothetical protein